LGFPFVYLDSARFTITHSVLWRTQVSGTPPSLSVRTSLWLPRVCCCYSDGVVVFGCDGVGSRYPLEESLESSGFEYDAYLLFSSSSYVHGLTSHRHRLRTNTLCGWRREVRVREPRIVIITLNDNNSNL